MAFTQAPIALVTALRETSIVFALLIGVFMLKERLDLPKVLSTAATLTGAVLLRFGRQIREASAPDPYGNHEPPKQPFQGSGGKLDLGK